MIEPISEFVELWRQSETEVEMEQKKLNDSGNGKQYTDITIENVDEMLKCIIKKYGRPGYDLWIELINAIWDKFSFEESFPIIKKYMPEEKPNEYEYKYRNRLTRIHFGTLVYYAKECGWKSNTKERPQIIIQGGELHRIVTQSENVLINSNLPLFQRSGQLARLITIENPSQVDGIKRNPGSILINPVDENWLQLKLTGLVQFKKYDSRAKDYLQKDCPPNVPRALLALGGEWLFPHLSGIIESPTLRNDGSILQKAGYDPQSKLFLSLNGEFPPLPENPTKHEALRSLNRLKKPFQKFPFVSRPDFSVILVGILTALIRKSIRSAPVTGITSPTMGTGKSLLTDCISILATGHSAVVMSQGKDINEDEKRLFSVLMTGDPLIVIDNVERPVEGDALATILTQPVYASRILGISKISHVPTNSTFFITGNNLTFKGDMSTRALLCRIDAGIECPEERKFEGDLRKELLQNRGMLVKDALTILRAYHVAGRPIQKIKPYGRFEEWSNWIRSALVWLGEADPNETRERINRQDPIQQKLSAVTNAWYNFYGEKPKTARQVIEDLNQIDILNDEKLRNLQNSIELVAERKGKINVRAFGIWLSSIEDRISNNLKFVKFGDYQNMPLWKIEKIL